MKTNKQELIKIHGTTKKLLNRAINNHKRKYGFKLSYNEVILLILKGGGKK